MPLTDHSIGVPTSQTESTHTLQAQCHQWGPAGWVVLGGGKRYGLVSGTDLCRKMHSDVC